ncbi:GGDEF domain-containing protein [Roseomonas sp. BN140053]|uniref:GGDEF domain-containing protein n=1 Tax=Roseomonas sp. BN140053 TaxID=3391898 RepID=UPI0039EC8A14
MKLDGSTLLLVSGAVLLLLCLLCLAFWRQHRAEKALGWLTAQTLFLLIGGTLLDLLPNRAAGLGNAFLLLAAGTGLAAVRALDQRGTPAWAIGGPALVWLAIGQAGALASGAGTRVALISLLLAGYALATAWQFGRTGNRDALRSRRLLSAVLLAHGAYMLLRAALAGTLPAPWAATRQDWLLLLPLEGVLYGLAMLFAVTNLVWEAREQRVRRGAGVDILTGLPNRTAFLDHATRLRSTPPALMIFDLDDFPRLMENHGAAAGDAALVQFANTLSEMLPSASFEGRLGGTEFAALVPVRSPQHARDLAGAVCKAFASRYAGNSGPRVTASAGLYASLDAPWDIRTALLFADAALYRAKRAGGNGVLLADDSANPGLCAGSPILMAGGRRRWRDLIFQPRPGATEGAEEPEPKEPAAGAPP